MKGLAADYLLKRPSSLTMWQSLLLRGLLVMSLFGVALLGHWIDRDGLRDNVDGKISFVDVVYFTTVTVTTVGYGDIVPVTDRARLFDTFVVTPIRVFVWFIFLGTAYAFLFQHVLERTRGAMILKRLNGHIILCGFGASGEAAVRDLIQQGRDPAMIVVLDKSDERTAAATALGVTTLVGDATLNAVLSAAGIERAAALLVSVHRDDTAALVVLSARQLNPAVQISASVRNGENEDLLRQAGANSIINPVSIGGHLLSRSSSDAHAVAFVRDMVSAEGRVVIRERQVSAEEVGKPMRAIRSGIGMRLLRGGQPVGYWEPGAECIEAGDIVVEIVEASHV